MHWQVVSTRRRRIRQRHRLPDTRPAESVGPIDLDVGVEAVMRHARYLPPHGSRTPSALGSFLFQQWTDHRRCKVTARIVPVEWYSTHLLAHVCRRGEPGSHHHGQIERPTGFASRAQNMVGGTMFQGSYFVISNHEHDNGFSSHSAETTGTGFNEAWVSEPWRRTEGRDAKLLEAIQTRTTVRDGGLVGADCKGSMGREQPMPSHLPLSILREASSNILTMFLADSEAMPVCPTQWRHCAIHDTHAQTV